MRFTIFISLWFLASLLGLARGGQAEKLGALLLLVMVIINIALRPLASVNIVQVFPAAALADGLLLAASFGLALLTTQRWPLWFCAAQLVRLLGHAMRYSLPSMAPAAYGVFTNGPVYIQCLAVIFGVIAYQRRHALAAKA
jgi:hypothetical protein